MPPKARASSAGTGTNRKATAAKGSPPPKKTNTKPLAARAELPEDRPKVSQGDLDFVREAFGLCECVDLGYPFEHRLKGAGPAGERGELVPCNAAGCWFGFDDLKEAVMKVLGRDAAYASELCWKILEDMNVFAFYQDCGQDGAVVELVRRAAEAPDMPLVEKQGEAEVRKNVVLGCAWTASPPRKHKAIVQTSGAAADESGNSEEPEIDVVVGLMGIEIPKLLYELDRLCKERWIKLTDIIATCRNLASATAAADAIAAILAMLKQRDIEPSKDWLGASPRAQELLKVVETHAREWLVAKLKQYNRYDPKLRTIEELVAALRAALAGEEKPKEEKDEEGWLEFCSKWDLIIGLDDLPDYPAWVPRVRMALWNGWDKIKFVFESNAAAGTVGSDELAMQLGLQEFSKLMKQVIPPHPPTHPPTLPPPSLPVALSTPSLPGRPSCLARTTMSRASTCSSTRSTPSTAARATSRRATASSHSTSSLRRSSGWRPKSTRTGWTSPTRSSTCSPSTCSSTAAAAPTRSRCSSQRCSRAPSRT